MNITDLPLFVNFDDMKVNNSLRKMLRKVLEPYEVDGWGGSDGDRADPDGSYHHGTDLTCEDVRTMVAFLDLLQSVDGEY